MHGLNVARRCSGGFDVNDPAIHVQHIYEALDPHTADHTFNSELDRRWFYCGCYLVEVLRDERLTGARKLQRILVIAELDLVTFQSPCFTEERQHTSNGQVLVSFDLLGKVLSEGGMHRTAENQVSVGWVWVSEDILEPPSRVAVHKGTNLRG